MPRRLATFALLLLTMSFTLRADDTPLPLPKRLRVQSAAPRGKVWDSLTKPQQMLAFHLAEAARAGNVLLFQQSHRYSVTLKEIFQKACKGRQIEVTRKVLGPEACGELLV